MLNDAPQHCNTFQTKNIKLEDPSETEAVEENMTWKHKKIEIETEME